MSKSLKRSLRRHHLERLKSKRQQYCGNYINSLSNDARERHIGILAQTARRCSCPLCGNPRKYWNELTIQERRHSIQRSAIQGSHEYAQ